MKTLLIVALCLTIGAGSLFAEKTVSVKRLGDYHMQYVDLGFTSRQDCQYGNLNPPAFAINDWIWGAEGYKYLFYPPDYVNCGCELGFWIDNVHMYMQFGAEDIPASFDVYVDLEEAVFDPASGCWLPGPEVCVSSVYNVGITASGLYDIAIPLFNDCDCAFMDYHYFLSFHILTSFPATSRPDAIIDEFPIGCTSYNDYGAGWEDLVVVYGFPGEIAMFADVACCYEPASGEDHTWGQVKSLYR